MTVVPGSSASSQVSCGKDFPDTTVTPRGLIILDRDGVLNEVVVDEEHGTIDSPLNPDQVRVFDFVPGALKQLNELGFLLAIATNQPAAAKGKTTRKNLERTHERVLEVATSAGAWIQSSHICYHRKEDRCPCRKPEIGLLEEALRLAITKGLSWHGTAGEGGRQSGVGPTQVWMVGDGVTDVEAGQKLGVRTAFLGPKKCDACKVMESRELTPSFWGSDLRDFVRVMSGAEGGDPFVPWSPER